MEIEKELYTCNTWVHTINVMHVKCNYKMEEEYIDVLAKLLLWHFIKARFPPLHFIKSNISIVVVHRSKILIVHFIKKTHCFFMLLPGSEGLFPSRGFLVIKGFFAVTSRVGWQRIGCSIKRFCSIVSIFKDIFRRESD